MKKTFMIICALICGTIAWAQQTTTTTVVTTTETITVVEPIDTSISKVLDVYIFPSNNQSDSLQKADETMCFEWAVEQTGYNPLANHPIEPEAVDKSADGTAVRGAARGALLGTAIGAIAGDTGKGAAIGATTGAVAGRRAKVIGDAQEQKTKEEAAAAEQLKEEENFKKAFMACMEGKGYTVK